MEQVCGMVLKLSLSLSLSHTRALGVERVHSSPGPVQQKTPGTVDKVIVVSVLKAATL